ncbi:MAG: metallophosphoesterase [Ruminococcaceae bacterium]|nr:metallophosphoesterase [Oscillospiraceae bacterium]
MKILVVSDTHGDTELLYSIVSKYRANTDLVIHLGDNLKDINEVMRDFPTIAKLGVLGNCDFASMYLDPVSEGCFTAEKRRIFYTHGHKYHVDYGSERLAANAKYKGADIVLYGHTHVALCKEQNGVLVINPGSLSRPRDNTNGTYVRLEVSGSDVKYDIIEVEK